MQHASPDMDPSESLINLKRTAVDFARLEQKPKSAGIERYNRVVSGIHQLMAGIEAERAWATYEEIQAALEPAIAVLEKSPFVTRVRSWPRGYPGDFETIEYLCRGEVHVPPGSVESHAERYFLQSAIASQHRNKVNEQARLLLQTCARRSNARVLVVACGSFRELLQVGSILPSTGVELVLNDVDEDALGLSRGRVADLGLEATVVPGDALTKLRTIRKLGPYDLILCGGLFDYLPTGVLRRFVPALVNGLNPGGSLFYTNIAAGNPYRGCMEHLGSWRLIERQERELLELSSGAQEKCKTVVSRDPTGLTLLARVTRGE